MGRRWRQRADVGNECHWKIINTKCVRPGTALKAGSDDVQKVCQGGKSAFQTFDVGVHNLSTPRAQATKPVTRESNSSCSRYARSFQVQGTFSYCKVSRAVKASGDERAELAKLQTVHGTRGTVMARGHRCSETCLRIGWGIASGCSTKESSVYEVKNLLFNSEAVALRRRQRRVPGGTAARSTPERAWLAWSATTCRQTTTAGPPGRRRHLRTRSPAR